MERRKKKLYQIISIYILHAISKGTQHIPSKNSDSEASGLKSTRRVEAGNGSEFPIIIFDPVSTIHITPSIRRIHHPTAFTRTRAIHPSEISKGARESEIKDDGDETEESHATEAADEEEANDGVDRRGARDTFGCANVVVDWEVVV